MPAFMPLLTSTGIESLQSLVRDSFHVSLGETSQGEHDHVIALHLGTRTSVVDRILERIEPAVADSSYMYPSIHLGGLGR